VIAALRSGRHKQVPKWASGENRRDPAPIESAFMLARRAAGIMMCHLRYKPAFALQREGLSLSSSMNLIIPSDDNPISNNCGLLALPPVNYAKDGNRHSQAARPRSGEFGAGRRGMRSRSYWSWRALAQALARHIVLATR